MQRRKETSIVIGPVRMRTANQRKYRESFQIDVYKRQAPSRSISREELAVMMYRYAKYRGQEGTVKGDLFV